MIKLDLSYRGIGRMLKSDGVREHLREVADEVARGVRSDPHLPRRAHVRTEDYETDRAAVAVVLDHEGGVGLEARYRIISDSARAAGLSVDD